MTILLKIIRGLAILVLLLSPAALIYTTVREPISNIKSKIKVLGLKQISKPEISKLIDDLKLENKSFYQINPQLIARHLNEFPLVHQVKVRGFLFPSPKYKIYIWEEQPWAIYQGTLYNQDANALVSPSSKFFKEPSIALIYEEFAKQSLLAPISIESRQALDHKALLNIKKLAQQASSSLNLIGRDKIKMISLDLENNLDIQFHKLRLSLGPINKDIEHKLAKLDSVLIPLQKLSKQEVIEYIDVSLDTDDVILGKGTVPEPVLITKAEPNIIKPSQ